MKGVRQFRRHKNDEDKERALLVNSIVLAHPPFFSLLQVCLHEADPLDGLFEQIDSFVQSAKELEDRVPDNLRTRQVLQECLSLRLALVGQRFRLLQQDAEMASRWALLLSQLIVHGVSEPHSNGPLFFTILDMLHTLVHTVVARYGLEGKIYQNMMKKMRREVTDRPFSAGTEHLRPLLLSGKSAYPVFVVMPIHQAGRGGSGPGGSGGPGGVPGGGQSSSNTGGSGGGAGKSGGAGKAGGSKFTGKAVSSGSSGLSGVPGSRDSGGGLLSTTASAAMATSIGGGMHTFARKRGYLVVRRERFQPWDLIDPSKQGILLSLYGAVQTEAQMSRVEEQANLLVSHEHPLFSRRSPDFYFDSVFIEGQESPLPLPSSSASNTVAASIPAAKTQSTQILPVKKLASESTEEEDITPFPTFSSRSDQKKFADSIKQDTGCNGGAAVGDNLYLDTQLPDDDVSKQDPSLELPVSSGLESVPGQVYSLQSDAMLGGPISMPISMQNDSIYSNNNINFATLPHVPSSMAAGSVTAAGNALAVVKSEPHTSASSGLCRPSELDNGHPPMTSHHPQHLQQQQQQKPPPTQQQNIYQHPQQQQQQRKQQAQYPTSTGQEYSTLPNMKTSESVGFESLCSQHLSNLPAQQHPQHQHHQQQGQSNLSGILFTQGSVVGRQQTRPIQSQGQSHSGQVSGVQMPPPLPPQPPMVSPASSSSGQATASQTPVTIPFSSSTSVASLHSFPGSSVSCS
ncbi:unnamed protein product, partial [Protopolystoma xenopodis]